MYLKYSKTFFVKTSILFLIFSISFLSNGAYLTFAEETSIENDVDEITEVVSDTSFVEDENTLKDISTPVEEDPETQSPTDNLDGESGGEIETENSVSQTDLTNEANTNTTEIGEEDIEQTEEVVDNEVSSSDDEATIETTGNEENHEPTSSSIEIDNKNEVEVNNGVETTSQTGENTTIGDGGAIVTGNSVAISNVVNVVNTNIFNSNGFISFFNQLFGIDTLDLRVMFDVFKDNEKSENPCSLESCEDSNVHINVSNENTATIKNDIIVRSSTGGNYTEGEDSFIETGDSYASSNLVNVANTNITDSNYLLLSFNNIGDFFGNVILPNADFFKNLFNVGGVSESVNIANSNSANITNNSEVVANTGDNSASGGENSDGGTINTGDAITNSSITNVINSNFTGSDSFTMLFRVSDSWSGNVFGLPEGLSWTRTPSGIEVYSTPSSNTKTISQTEIDSVTNNNQATIENNVKVYALTGENEIKGGGTINTGNAHASSNIVNIANTNVIGQNWALLIFNMFGNWDGNIAFGLPDLWIGGSATSNSTPVSDGEKITYTYTIANNGDLKASDVVFRLEYDENQLSYDHKGPEDKDGYYFELGTIKPGDFETITFDAYPNQNIPYGQTIINTKASVSSYEDDYNNDDNTENIDVLAERSIPESNNPNSKNSKNHKTPKSDIRIIKTVSEASATASSTVPYTITIINDGYSAYNTTLVDTLLDPDGNIIDEHFWDFERIFPKEEIQITYDVMFSENAKPGVYTNNAQLFGLDRSPTLKYGRKISTNISTAKVTILPVGEVLGEQFEGQCSEYITTFMRSGQENNKEEVAKLQNFLKEFEGFSNVEVNGEFDLQTEIAVRDFQKKYKNEILAPWGVSRESGFVYLTTRKKINEIYCNDRTQFPLSYQEQLEIDSFKTIYTRTSDEYGFNTNTPLENDPVIDDIEFTVKQNRNAEPTEKVFNIPQKPKNDKEKGFLKSFTGIFDKLFSLFGNTEKQNVTQKLI